MLHLRRFFAVGEAGMILSSGDGATWVREVSPANVRLNGVRRGYGAGVVQAVGEAGAGGTHARCEGAWARRDAGFGERWMRGLAESGFVVGQRGAFRLAKGQD